MTKRNVRRFIGLGVVVLVFAARQMGWLPETGGDPVPPAPRERAADRSANLPSASAASGTIERLFQDGRSDEIVEDEGRVIAILADDNKGSRHQRLLLELGSGHTVLIAHNIDLAPRIQSVRKGDRVRFRGEFEWNDRGGVIHWTHHDPAGRHPGGWLRHEGKTYE